MWIGTKEILGKRAREADEGVMTLSVQEGEMISSATGKRYLSVEHYRTQGIPRMPNKTCDTESNEGIAAWAEASVGASKREDIDWFERVERARKSGRTGM